MKEDLVASGCISRHTKEHKNSVVPPKLVYIQVRHLVIQGCHTCKETSSGEQDSVRARLSMLYPELFTVSKTLWVLLDEVGSFEANVQTQLLLALNELVNIMDGARFLAAPARSHVVPSGLTLIQHFFFIFKLIKL